MIKKKLLILLLAAMFVSIFSITVYDYWQQKAEAQSCVAIPSTGFRISQWRDVANHTSLGAWTYCALNQVEGIDNGGGDGVGVRPYDNDQSHTWAFAPGTKPTWTVWRGDNVDHFQVICIDLFYE